MKWTRLIKANNERFTVEREDLGKSDIYENKRDRQFYIYDNVKQETHQDEDGNVYYFDSFEEAQEMCNELNNL